MGVHVGVLTTSTYYLHPLPTPTMWCGDVPVYHPFLLVQISLPVFFLSSRSTVPLFEQVGLETRVTCNTAAVKKKLVS